MPTPFTDQQKVLIKTEICDWIAEGNTLREYCRQTGSPAWKTVYQWLAGDEDFKSRFTHARDIGFDAIAEEALKISDTPVEGVKYEHGPMGSKEVREDMLGHRKLQIETRLKLLAKWSPKKYGEKLDHTSSDGSMSPKGSTLEELTDDQLAAIATAAPCNTSQP